ncbi:MAG: RND family transporter, partial [Halanaerobiales bacterium]|nr:RND family transporter [Halanaerobiales bacterium]
SNELAELKGVASIKSLTTINQIQSSEMGLEITKLIDEVPIDGKKLYQFKKKITSDPMYGGLIVSKDGSSALTIIEVDPEADSVELAKNVISVTEKYQGPERIYITGTPVLNEVLSTSMKQDLRLLLPIVLIIIGFILFLFFRSIKGVLLPFTTVIISVVWTIGLMGLLEKQLSPLNAVMPVILISLGNAYGIYILNRHRQEMKKNINTKQAVKNTITTVGLSILMAGGTTIAGFASNIFSDITLMRDFGIYTSFGVGIALIISLTFIPAVLSLLKVDTKKKTVQNTKSLMNQFIHFLADFTLSKAKVILIVSIIIVLVAGFGIPKLETDSNFFNFFDESSEPKIAYNLVKDKFSGSESIEVIVEGDMQNSSNLKAISDFQSDLKQNKAVGKITSIANIMKRTNKVMNDNNEDFYIIPDDSNLISQYLLLIEMNDNEYLKDFVTLDYQKARIQILVSDTSTEAVDRLMNDVEMYAEENFNELSLKGTVSGMIVLIESLADMIIEGQIKGLVFALIAVFIIVFTLLRSFQGSILSVLLISLVTSINFGVMGYFGIPLDIVTVLISSIGVGVGIDYSIHILSRYQEEKDKNNNIKTALHTAITGIGTSIISNAGAVIGGFIMLILSSFPPFRYFGILVSLIMFTAALGAIIWIPAVILVYENYKGGVRKKHLNYFGKINLR